MPNIEEALGIAEMVVNQITTMGRERTSLYDNSFRFGDGLPNCVLNNFAVMHLCRKCLLYKYARRVQDLC